MIVILGVSLLSQMLQNVFFIRQKRKSFSDEDYDTLPLITLLRIGKSVHIRVPAFFILYLIKGEMKTIDQSRGLYSLLYRYNLIDKILHFLWFL